MIRVSDFFVNIFAVNASEKVGFIQEKKPDCNVVVGLKVDVTGWVILVPQMDASARGN